MINSDEINVLFSTDDAYTQHLGAAIHSLLSHNKDVRTLNIYIIDNEIQPENRQRLLDIGALFPNCHLHFISFAKWRGELRLNMLWEISISSYGRLFVGSMMPKDADRVIYMDCDMIVRDSLVDLWTQPLGDKIVGAIQDSVPADSKEPVEMEAADPYFNAGLLLIDLKKWREQNLEDEALRFIDYHKGAVQHHDQGVLNGILRNRWQRLPLRYNLMTIHYMYSPKQIKAYYKDSAPFYSDDEIARAKDKPGILHFTPSFTSRPWVSNCCHPLRSIYWDTVELTPWRGAKPQADNAKLTARVANWWFRTFKP